jgi:DNA-binding YbaB/EbfC family protein
MNLNPFDLMKNAQKMQEQLQVMQGKLSEITAKGSSGGGMVEVELNGRMELLSVQIHDQALTDAAMAGDLIVAAHSVAMEKVRESIAREMRSLYAEMGIPEGLMSGGFPMGMPV